MADKFKSMPSREAMRAKIERDPDLPVEAGLPPSRAGATGEVEQVNALADVLRDAYERHTDGHPLCDMGRPYSKRGSHRLAVEMAEAARTALLAELAATAGEEVTALVEELGQCSCNKGKLRCGCEGQSCHPSCLEGDVCSRCEGTGLKPKARAILAHVASLAQRAEQAEAHKQLHAGDVLSLSGELDEWKGRAEEAESLAVQARVDLANSDRRRHAAESERDEALVPGDAPARDARGEE